MYAFTSLPLVRRTRATFRKAELGFLGVVVYTRVHTPRFCGQASIAGTLLRATCHLRGLRMSWFIVGIVTTSSNETTARRLCHAGAVVSHYQVLTHLLWERAAAHSAQRSLPGAFLRSTAHELRISSDACAPGQALPGNHPLGRGFVSGRPLFVFDELNSLFLIGRDRGQLAITLGSDFAQPSDDTAGTRRDQPSDDHVLLEPSQCVDPARYCGLGQHARRLLKRR